MNNDNWVRDMLKERLELKGLPEDDKLNNFCNELQELFDTIKLYPKIELINDKEMIYRVEFVKQEGAKEKALEIIDRLTNKYCNNK